MVVRINMRFFNRIASRRELHALEAYVNLGDKPDDWARFRNAWPDFFPTKDTGIRREGFRNTSEWLYTYAEEWAKQAEENPEIVTQSLPPLLWFRNRLRALWTRNDPYGWNLAVLLGFKQEAEEIAKEHPGIQAEGLEHPVIPEEMIGSSQQSIGGLLPGRPRFDGVSGEIRWEFGCTLQRAVYTLMQNRWRAMVCAACGRYFLAEKTAQKHCSERCYVEVKRQKARDRWDEKGWKEREARLKLKRKSKSPRKRRTR